MSFGPRRHRLFRQKNTYGIGQLTIRSHVEYELFSRCLGIVPQRRSLPNKVVLIDVSLIPRVGLQASHGFIRRHADIMNGRDQFVVPAKFTIV